MFKPDGHHAFLRAAERFNLLSEILFVQAQCIEDSLISRLKFQSLERDSVCSSSNLVLPGLLTCKSFNLLSEILFVQARERQIQYFKHRQFQSLERDSVCSSMAI